MYREKPLLSPKPGSGPSRRGHAFDAVKKRRTNRIERHDANVALHPAGDPIEIDFRPAGKRALKGVFVKKRHKEDDSLLAVAS